MCDEITSEQSISQLMATDTSSSIDVQSNFTLTPGPTDFLRHTKVSASSSYLWVTNAEDEKIADTIRSVCSFIVI